MGLPAAKHKMTLEDFLAREAGQRERREFFDGEAFMRAGGPDVHKAIRLNAAFGLRAAFAGSRCPPSASSSHSPTCTATFRTQRPQRTQPPTDPLTE